MSSSQEKQEIPDIIYDSGRKITYKKGRFLGKGGFAKCYEIIDAVRKDTHAAKIVSKQLMIKSTQREKMTQEINIHRSLDHKHVVGFKSFFEDIHNVYIVLEYCRKRSMMELHKRRKTITEPEMRFYMKQLLGGVNYLHNINIIHRDLKLGNLFLNDEMHVKIGDFGLAAKLEHADERKKTLCGTPNYIAPEILTKKGHSFEVDVWSIGCIMYTLLVGKPPFETSSLKETYAKIKKGEYQLVTNISQPAKQMIIFMLQSDPKQRPKVSKLLRHEFLMAYTPSSLPASALTMTPRFENASVRTPLGLLSNAKIRNEEANDSNLATGSTKSTLSFDPKANFIAILNLMKELKRMAPLENLKYTDEMSDPAAQPIIWISKWVDYSDKYGFGYHLADESVGVMFNDMTKLIMLPNGINVHYVDKTGDESYMTCSVFPKEHDKKMKLLAYFNRYMREHLIKTGAHLARDSDTMSRIPHLHQWCRSNSGVLMQLTNGTVQMNFGDHTKVVICPLMSAISYIDEDKSFRTFRFATLAKIGCTVPLHQKLCYAYNKISLLLQGSDI